MRAHYGSLALLMAYSPHLAKVGDTDPDEAVPISPTPEPAPTARRAAPPNREREAARRRAQDERAASKSGRGPG